MQEAQTYGFEDPETLNENRSMGRMGISTDGMMLYIHGEGWRELKVGCVSDTVSRQHKGPAMAEHLLSACSAILSNRFDKIWHLAYHSSPN
ncbi:MAG: hypothetical protein ACPL6F_00130 [Anaerolineales bacterium]